MKFKIVYYKEIQEDISKFSNDLKARIRNDINKKLVASPEVFGKPLQKSLRGLRTLRCGNYRIIFEIKKKQVNIVLICHRSIVYKKALERLNKSL